MDVGPAAWSSWSWPLMLLNDTIDMHTHKRDIHYPCLKKSSKRCPPPSPPPQLTCTHACMHAHTHTQTSRLYQPQAQKKSTIQHFFVCAVYPSFELSDKEHLGGKTAKVQEKDDNWNPKGETVSHRTNKQTLRKTEDRSLLRIQTFLAAWDCLGHSVCSHSNHVVDCIPMLGPTAGEF